MSQESNNGLVRIFSARACAEPLEEAAATSEFDAAFGWTSFQHLEPGRIEIIELPQEQQVLRGTGVGMLSFAKNIESARKLMNFLTTPEARAFYQEFGWVLEDD